MIAIKIDFPAGRWHATAWGSHVNEGSPEWPPCPWRLCRALIAAWYWKHREEEGVLRSLIEKLASHPPDYKLPKASAAHTRHYMPVIAGPKVTKTKIFDTFLHVASGDSLWIRWDVELDLAEQFLLRFLIESLSYLGRAESLISATLEDMMPVGGDWTCPFAQSRLDDGESIRLLAPQISANYQEWSRQQAGATGTSKGKSRKKTGSLPTSVFDALQVDTADWKNEGWNAPPGSRWIEYLRPRNSLGIAPSSPPVNRQGGKTPSVARFAITSKVPPAITQALSLSERFHQALCSLLPKEQNCPSLTGCDETGASLLGNRHTYFLPECDDHGYVTHMTIHAPGGFDDPACRAFGKLRKVWGIEGFEVNIVLLAVGQPENFEKSCPYFRKAVAWASITPFVPVRHAKASRAGLPKIDPQNHLQVGSPEHDCWRLLEMTLRDHAENAIVQSVTSTGFRIRHGLRDISCLDFQRLRKTGQGKRAGSRGHALTIEFTQPTSCPFGLGYGAHFGLGLFLPVLD